MIESTNNSVMTRFMRVIHVLADSARSEDVDGPDKPGHDGFFTTGRKRYRPAFLADASGSGGFGCSGLPRPASSRIQRQKALTFGFLRLPSG